MKMGKQTRRERVLSHEIHLKHSIGCLFGREGIFQLELKEARCGACVRSIEAQGRVKGGWGEISWQ